MSSHPYRSLRRWWFTRMPHRFWTPLRANWCARCGRHWDEHKEGIAQAQERLKRSSED
jgi:hypothetical protein